MNATILQGKITADRKLVVQIPREIAPGAVQVILVPAPSPKPRRRARPKVVHPAFGIWANRPDITDSAAYAAELRKRIERREDGEH